MLDLVRDCASRNVKALQLFTGRFSETGRPEGIALEKTLIETARAEGVRIIGPNCMGLLYPEHGISFRTDMSRTPGNIGFMSQSGNLLFELTHFGESRGFNFSKAISYGNAIDLNEADFLRYFAEDDETKVIGAYIEGVKDGRRFLAALKARLGQEASPRAEGRTHGCRRTDGRVAHCRARRRQRGLAGGGRAGWGALGGHSRGPHRPLDRVLADEAPSRASG